MHENRWTTSERIEVIRTPDECFDKLPDYPFVPNYAEVYGMRVHYIDENQVADKVVVMLHGEPTWSYLYRHMIPHFVAAGYRVIVPDIPGFGKSDKPTQTASYSYQGMVNWVENLLFEKLNLHNIHFVVHDWGGLIGLRMVARQPDRFSKVVIMNTDLPRGQGFKPLFLIWWLVAKIISYLPYRLLIPIGCYRPLYKEQFAGYDAPFPSRKYKTAALTVERLVPVFPWQKESRVNKLLWSKLGVFDKPFLVLFGDKDFLTKGIDKQFIKHVKGAKGQPHQRLKRAGHFIQEDNPDEASRLILDFFNNKI